MFIKNKKQISASRILSDMNVREILLYGGSRSGKTAFIIRSIILRAIEYPSKHLIVRFRLNHVKQSIWHDTLPKVLGLMGGNLKNKCHPNNSDLFYKVPTQYKDDENNILYSEIWIGGLDDVQRTEKILGTEYSTIFFNEISQISYKSFLMGKTRLSEKNPLRKLIFTDENPPTKKHWSYKYFIQGIDPLENRPLNKEKIRYLQINPDDNKDNIDKDYIEALDDLPERQKKRFRDGEFQDEGEGKVFKEKWIKRTWEALPKSIRTIVAIDPAVTKGENSDEYGIIVIGRSGDYGFIIADYSDKLTPDEMAVTAIKAYKDFNCNNIVVETNNGGDHIEAVLKHNDRFIPVKQVRASRGKVKRAIPVAHLYEKGLIYHAGNFPELEEEMWTFTEDEADMKGLPSPNRCDALVWGIIELFELSYSEPKIRMI
jgi:PBSX family phage terminase large subunit